MLDLKDNEGILFFMKIGINPFLKNDQKAARLLWVGTQQRFIFLDYYRFPIRPANVHGWTAKDEIPFSEITDITAKKKTFTLSPEPIISIRTASDDKYEVVFYTEQSCRNKFHDLQTIIKDVNPKPEFKNEI